MTLLKIAALTGKLGGYSAMKPMLLLMRDDPCVSLFLLVTDQNMIGEFGYFGHAIGDSFPYWGIPMEQEGDTFRDRTRAEALGMRRISDALCTLEPDILVLFGDRGESLAAAHAALNANIPIAHIQGGDTTGGVDDKIRDAITCMSDLHFVSCASSQERVENMIWEEPGLTIHKVGDFHIDPIAVGDYLSPKEVQEELELDGDSIILVTHHPDTLRPEASYSDMCNVLEAVTSACLTDNIVVTYPCSDTGYKGTIKAIEEYADMYEWIKVYKYLHPPLYRGVLACARVLVGNSSAGIIESPYLKTPSVDVGDRQNGRIRGNSVLHSEQDRESIYTQIQSSLDYSDVVGPPLYGNGTAGQQTLTEIKKWYKNRSQETEDNDLSS